MRPYLILPKAGLDILFTGIITEKVMDSISMDKLIGSFVTLQDASHEVGKICNAYKTDDIDLTILLTHIGYESDIKLAKMLKPDWGVDMIIGGHSHTFLEKPAKVNNILIAQSGTGTNQIGRFDITVDDDTNKIINYKWRCVQINNKIAKSDRRLVEFIRSFKKEVDQKYNTIICKFTQKLTHPKREIETSLGNLFADIYAEVGLIDVMFVGSGSIRSKEMGPVVTLMDLKACFPYDDSITKFTIQGKKLKIIFTHIMRPENRNNEGECYQVNDTVKAVYVDKTKTLESLTINSEPIDDFRLYTIGLQGYHANSSKAFLNISPEELREDGKSTVVSTSAAEVLEEYLRAHQNLDKKVEGRLEYQ